jgi:hypothetical protein
VVVLKAKVSIKTKKWLKTKKVVLKNKSGFLHEYQCLNKKVPSLKIHFYIEI